MNYLVHLYLSDHDENLLVGNFIADNVKGNKVNDYPTEISKGILLHRAIDEFSDRHPAVSASIKLLRPVYGKYAGVAVDIFYDHFLAAGFDNYSSESLIDFSKYCHTTLIKNWLIIPWDVKMFLPFMIKHKWLQSYAELSGITGALSNMAKHTSLPDKADEATSVLQKNYGEFRANFTRFFPDLQSFSSDKIKLLRTTQ